MYSGLEQPSQWVLPAVLVEMAERVPGKRWIETTDGDSLDFARAASDMHRVGGYLASIGVQHGDYVAILMRSSVEAIRAWLGVTRLGAVAVLLNPELSGSFLSHQLRTAGSSLAIVDEDLLTRLEAIEKDLPFLRQIIVVGDPQDREPDRSGSVRFLDWARWRCATPWQGPMPAASDISTVMYTSGTSGPSKGVLMPHAHCTLYGIGVIEATGLSQADTYYVTMPLFHANGLLMQLGSSLLCGATAIVRPRFSASKWVSDVKAFKATITNLLGSMSAFILAQDPDAGDADHLLRVVISSPNVPEHDHSFRTRFGVKDVISGFGMTEVNIPIWGRVGVAAPGAAGWPYSRYFDVVIANPETDVAVEPGTVGEILIRPKVPFGFMAGYMGMPEKTVEAWRNLWFHTGDAATMAVDGRVVFIDRIKDCIRRRGENISPRRLKR